MERLNDKVFVVPDDMFEKIKELAGSEGTASIYGMALRARDWMPDDRYYLLDGNTANVADIIARLSGAEKAVEFLDKLEKRDATADQDLDREAEE